MAAGCGEDLDLPSIGPASQRVGVDPEDAARLPQRQPVTVLERRLGDTVNLGELPANVERSVRFRLPGSLSSRADKDRRFRHPL